MTPIVKCERLSKLYENGKGIKEFDVSIPRGKIVGILGSNGSGKSTFIKLINGLLNPTKGKILIDGMKLGIDTKKIISYLPERNSLYLWMKVKELVRFYSDFFEDFNEEKAIKMIETLNIDKEAKLKTLSKGNREKIQLVLTMARKAKLYCLDEPIGGVDPAAREFIVETILNNYNKEATLLISTHMISDIESILDYCIFIKDGEILKTISVEEIKNERISVDEFFRRMYR